MESNTPRSRLGPAVVLLLLATLLLVTADSAGARRWDGPLGPAWEPGQWAGGSRAVQIGQPVYTGDVRLCVTRRATAVLEDIEPAQHFGEFRMDEKFMRPPAMTVDTTEPTVADRDFADNLIDRPCDGQSPLPSVGFRLTRLAAGHAGFDGLILTYRVNGVHYRYLYRFSFGLCDPACDGGIGLIGVCGSGPESAQASDSPLTGPLGPLVLDPMAATASRTAPIGSPAVFETGTLCRTAQLPLPDQRLAHVVRPGSDQPETGRVRRLLSWSSSLGRVGSVERFLSEARAASLRPARHGRLRFRRG